MVAKRPHLSQESSREVSDDNLGAANTARRGLISLARTVSPPPALKKHKSQKVHNNDILGEIKSTAAAIEAGEKVITDHVAFYSSHLLSAMRPGLPDSPRLGHADWIDLYTRNANSVKGSHFVIHQHDHPIAGTHYDLRLQCNPTSSISFAIMYGLPGDANSRRLNRNAMETRVHCLWNHLIEAASHATGSMLIWDTGEYEVLPHRGEAEGDVNTDDEDGCRTIDTSSEQEKLKRSFQRRKIKLRLHGTRLPPGYTLSLRLMQENFRGEQPKKPNKRRRRKAQDASTQHGSSDSDRESSDAVKPRPRRSLPSLSRLASPPPSPSATRIVDDEIVKSEDAAAVASDDEDELIRANNAYTGAINDVGSIHQRRWLLSLDRTACGFVKQTSESCSGFVETTWVRRSIDDLLADGKIDASSGFERFLVGGRETERSVITGRLASEILADEGMVGYVPRGHWRPITE